jgi:hypothetical protein
MQLPDDFPLEPIDAHGRSLALGSYVSVVAVASCARGLPQEDQNRLLGIVGERRKIVEIDRFGFIWLSFSSSDHTADFCLLPTEVAGD